ncbi:YitT family protein [Cohnella cholangitidis]|uniref:YitT family protein n=1 Tax=Cohnella cholangitidis TaxID=2598458 RepID=A0A7G5C5C0_9BACL|nr:YitT family protein [Cohnella cholangitidis]QMV44404.1 YitT family protein [Cohnella cholangitidis]
MSRSNLWSSIRSWSLLLAGTALYAFGLQYFIIPNLLMEGGVTGVAVLLNYALDFPVWLSSLLINLPLFILGWRQLGKGAMIYTFAGTVLLSFFLWIAETLVARGWLTPFKSEQDFILVVLYAGVTLGIGLGLVFRAGGTTGGVDIVARILHRARGWSMGQIILSLDVLILGVSLLFIPKEKVLYTLVSVFIASKIIDFIQEGAYSAKAFTILCQAPDKLAKVITLELDRGVTLMPAIGAYSGENKTIVYCVVSRFEIRKLKSLVRQHDRRAFIVINDVHDVLGEGFRDE